MVVKFMVKNVIVEMFMVEKSMAERSSLEKFIIEEFMLKALLVDTWELKISGLKCPLTWSKCQSCCGTQLPVNVLHN